MAAHFTGKKIHGCWGGRGKRGSAESGTALMHNITLRKGKKLTIHHLQFFFVKDHYNATTNATKTANIFLPAFLTPGCFSLVSIPLLVLLVQL